MNFNEGLFYFYLIATGLLGIRGTIRGLRLVCGWEPRFAEEPASVKWFIFVRSLTELAFLYVAYQLFKRNIMDPLPIMLMATLFGLVMIGCSFLVGNHFKKKNADARDPL